MELVLSGLIYDVCLIYLDAIFVFSRSFEEQYTILAAMFDRLERHMLKLKAAKCHLFQRKVTFLGHVASENCKKATQTFVYNKWGGLTIDGNFGLF